MGLSTVYRNVSLSYQKDFHKVIWTIRDTHFKKGLLKWKYETGDAEIVSWGRKVKRKKIQIFEKVKFWYAVTEMIFVLFYSLTPN